jgi:phytoene dehydrogenase-like protein
MSDYDVVVIGAGPNGLMTSALLQADGKKVCCAELNDHVGGLASNAHEFPGYVHNRGMWFLMFAHIDELLKKLDLAKYGLEFMDPPHVVVVLPENPPDPVFRMYNDPRETMEDLGRSFGKEGVEGFAGLLKFLEPFTVGMDYALANEPVSIGQMIDRIPSHEGQQALQTILYGSATELMDRFFPDKKKFAPLRGYLGSFSTDGFYGGPMTPGSALTVAYHFGTPTEGEGATGSQFKVCRGHMGMFCESLARSLEDHGGTLLKNAEVTKILVRDGTAYGVRLADGREITADVVVSSCDAYNTFVNMVGVDDTPQWLVDGIRRINYKETITQSYLTFDGLPEFRSEYDFLNKDDWRFNIWNMGDGELYEQGWDAVKFGKVPDRIGGGLYFPSMLDPTLAPPGHHTATFCDTNSWPHDVPPDRVDEVKAQVFNTIVDRYEKFLPDFREHLLDWKLMAPQDYQRMYHNTGGTWTHGMIEIKQMFDMRPVKGMSNFRAPIKHMYLCGASNHPGPGVNGRSPQICINAMKADRVI